MTYHIDPKGNIKEPLVIKISFTFEARQTFTNEINKHQRVISYDDHNDIDFALYLPWKGQAISVVLSDYDDFNEPSIWKIHYFNWLLQHTDIDYFLNVNKVRSALADIESLKSLADELLATDRISLAGRGIRYE